MNPEGRVRVYNWTRAMETYTELGWDEKLRFLVKGCSRVYDNPFVEGNQLLVTYNGHDLVSPTFPLYDFYSETWDLPGTKSKIKKRWVTERLEKAVEIIGFMMNECEVADWTVWERVTKGTDSVKGRS